MKKALIIIILILGALLLNIVVANDFDGFSLSDLDFNPQYIFDNPNIQEPKVNFYLNNEYRALDYNINWNYKDYFGKYIENKSDFSQNSQDPILTKNDELSLYCDLDFDKTNFRIYQEDTLISSGDTFDEAIDNISEEGDYKVEVEAVWEEKEDRDYHGSITSTAILEFELDPLVSFNTDNIPPGNVLFIYVDNVDEDENIEIETNAPVGSISKGISGNRQTFILPIDIWAQQGSYKISLEINDDSGNNVTIEKEFNVVSKDFPTQYLYISQEISDSTRNDEAYEEFGEYVQKARSNISSEKLWEGKFEIPVKEDYILTTDYGEIRYVNDEITSSRHSGLDLAAPEGTPIYACNSGNVVLAKDMILTGNTIIIDHGLGLYTSYYHLSSMDVENGDFVYKGDFVGEIGSTGFSTGPHLHWSISVLNTYVNTHQFIEEDVE
ncbi:MAG: M23 family metallopeptidase [Bacillota bacterium]|nr:M23 family metallopeptidase [Bacillota bacterium]